VRVEWAEASAGDRYTLYEVTWGILISGTGGFFFFIPFLPYSSLNEPSKDEKRKVNPFEMRFDNATADSASAVPSKHAFGLSEIDV